MNPHGRGIPSALGRYEIIERIGGGGMGEVFVGRVAGPGGFIRPVAVKRIHPHLAKLEDFVQMLHDEANVSAAVRHPNIVATIDVGSDGDNHFVVLDYVSGMPLSRLVKELRRKGATMPPWIAAWVGANVAAALHAAHETKNSRGESLELVHRDVSLGNVLLTDDGYPMLFDFGIAKAKGKLHQTAQGELKGKLAYMPPEMFSGAQVTRAVDIWSLGVVLYELLTGYSPFQRASDLDTIMAVKSGIVPPPSAVRASIDPRLDPIVLTAMTVERGRRFETAAQIEEALRGWARAAGEPHEAAPVATWLAWASPEALAARRALLARVTDPGYAPRLDPPPATPIPTPSDPHDAPWAALAPQAPAIPSQIGPYGRTTMTSDPVELLPEGLIPRGPAQPFPFHAPAGSRSSNPPSTTTSSNPPAPLRPSHPPPSRVSQPPLVRGLPPADPASAPVPVAATSRRWTLFAVIATVLGGVLGYFALRMAFSHGPPPAQPAATPTAQSAFTAAPEANPAPPVAASAPEAPTASAPLPAP
jgi:eukaryotic-like serine/threonine-protein kinase